VAVILKTGVFVVVALRSGESCDGVFGGEFPVIVKVAVLEVPGLITVTLAVPPEAISPDGTVAVSCVPELYVVESEEPFHCTVEEERKLDPTTVNENELPPAIVDVGLMDPMIGAGRTPLVIVKFCEPEVPPPGAAFVTTIGTVPVEEIFPAGTVPCSDVEEIKLVVRAEPFHFTTDVGTKFVPLTASEN